MNGMPYSTQKFFRTVRNNILAGILLIIPVAGSIFILVKLFTWADAVLPGMLGLHWVSGVGIAVSLVIAYMLGFLAKNWLGRKIIATGNAIIINIPILNKIYLLLKQIIDAVSIDRKKLFERVVMIEFPRSGSFALGLVTSEANAGFSAKAGRKLLAVFMPKVPNPTTGFLLYIPEEEVITLDIPVEAAIKLIVSGGLLGADAFDGTVKLPVSAKQWNWMDIFGGKARRKKHAQFDPRD
jgi:uncharacterized membrane protein